MSMFFDDDANASSDDEDIPEAMQEGSINPDEGDNASKEVTIPLFTFGEDRHDNMARLLLVMKSAEVFSAILSARGLARWCTAQQGIMDQGLAIGQVIIEACHDALVAFIEDVLRGKFSRNVHNLEKLSRVECIEIMQDVIEFDPNFNVMQTPDIVCFGLNCEFDNGSPLILEITTAGNQIIEEKMIKYGVDSPTSHTMIIKIDRKSTEMSLLTFKHRGTPIMCWMETILSEVAIKEKMRLILIDFNAILEQNSANYFDKSDVVIKGNFTATIWELQVNAIFSLYDSASDRIMLQKMGVDFEKGGTDVKRVNRAVHNLSILENLCGKKLNTLEGTLEDREHLEECKQMGEEIMENYIRFVPGEPHEPMATIDGLLDAEGLDVPKSHLTMFPRLMDPFWDYRIGSGYAGKDMDGYRIKEIWDWLSEGNTSFTNTKRGTNIFNEIHGMVAKGLKKQKIDFSNTVITDRLEVGAKVRSTERLGHFTYGKENPESMKYPYHQEISERYLMDCHNNVDTEEGMICELDGFYSPDVFHPKTQKAPDNILSRNILEYTLKQCKGKLADMEHIGKKTAQHMVREHRGKNYETVSLTALDGYFPVYQGHPEVQHFMRENRGNRRHVERQQMSTNLLQPHQFPCYHTTTMEGERLDLCRLDLQWGLLFMRDCPQIFYETQPIRCILVYKRHVTDPEFDAKLNLEGHLIDEIDLGEGDFLVAIQYKTDHYKLAAVNQVDTRIAGILEQVETIVYKSELIVDVGDEKMQDDDNSDSEEFMSAEDNDEDRSNIRETIDQADKRKGIKLRNGFIYPSNVTQKDIHNAVLTWLDKHETKVPKIFNPNFGKCVNPREEGQRMDPCGFLKSLRYCLSLLCSSSAREMEPINLLKGLCNAIDGSLAPFRLGCDFGEVCTISTYKYGSRSLLLDCWNALEAAGIIELVEFDPNDPEGMIRSKIHEISKEPKLIDATYNDKSGVLHPFLEKVGIETDEIQEDVEGMIAATREVLSEWRDARCLQEQYPLQDIDTSDPSIREIFRVRDDQLTDSPIEAKYYNGVDITTKSGGYMQRSATTKRIA